MSTFRTIKIGPPDSRLRFSYSAWTRWVSVFCVLMFGLASTAQAAHLHGLGAGSGVHKVQASEGGSKAYTDEEHCPLCIAVHWALPATMVTGPAPASALTAIVRACREVAAPSVWPFARFGRPPPLAG